MEEAQTAVKFENDALALEVIQAAGCQVTLNAQMKPTAARQSYEKSIKTVAKEVSIPGFRKGKAPRDIIVKRFSHAVEKEWEDNLLNDGFREALALSKLLPLTDKSVKRAVVNTRSLETGADISIEFEAAPSIPEIKLSEIVIQEEPLAEISESDIQSTLADLARYKAKHEGVTDRPVQQGDRAHIELSSVQAGEEKLLNASVYFDMSKEDTPEWLCRALIGKNIGDVVEMDSEPHESITAEEKEAFVPLRYKAKLQKIEVTVLPPIDDAFATLVGATSLDALKDQVRKRMTRELEDARHQEMSEKAAHALLTQASFDVPASAMNDELRHRMEQKIAALKKEGVDSKGIEEKRSELELEVKKETEEALRLHFLARHYLSLRCFEISKDDLAMQVNMLMPLLGRRQPSKEEMHYLYAQAYSLVLTRKFKEYILGQVQRSLQLPN